MVFLLSANALQMDNTSSGEFNWSPQRGESGETFFCGVFSETCWSLDTVTVEDPFMDGWIDRLQR